MRILELALITVLALASVATAGKTGGVEMPDTTTLAGKQLQLNGMGLREATWLDIDVYVAGLYVERVSSDAAALIASNETKLLVLRFVRNVGRSDIRKAWRDGFRHNATVALPMIQREIDQLDAWMVAFSKGDTLAFAFVPGEGVRVEINQKRVGTIKGEHFAHSLLAIWLGSSPPTKALKRGLLGNHGGAR